MTKEETVIKLLEQVIEKQNATLKVISKITKRPIVKISPEEDKKYLE